MPNPTAQVAYFVNSGSEANDMAIMMARLYSGNYDLLALRNAYHGMSSATMGLVAHSTWKYNVPQVHSSPLHRCCPPHCSALHSTALLSLQVTVFICMTLLRP